MASTLWGRGLGSTLLRGIDAQFRLLRLQEVKLNREAPVAGSRTGVGQSMASIHSRLARCSGEQVVFAAGSCWQAASPPRLQGSCTHLPPTRPACLMYSHQVAGGCASGCGSEYSEPCQCPDVSTFHSAIMAPLAQSPGLRARIREARRPKPVGVA